MSKWVDAAGKEVPYQELEPEDFESLKLLPTHFLEAMLRGEGVHTLHLTDGRTYQTTFADRVAQDAEGRLWLEFYVDWRVISIRLSELRYAVKEQGDGKDPKEVPS